MLGMCGAPGNCAAQMSLTLTLSRHRERELETGAVRTLTDVPVARHDSGRAKDSEGRVERIAVRAVFRAWRIVLA